MLNVASTVLGQYPSGTEYGSPLPFAALIAAEFVSESPCAPPANSAHGSWRSTRWLALMLKLPERPWPRRWLAWPGRRCTTRWSGRSCAYANACRYSGVRWMRRLPPSNLSEMPARRRSVHGRGNCVQIAEIRERARAHGRSCKGIDRQWRWTWNAGNDCVTGMISSRLMLRCGGNVAIQNNCSAMSSAVIGLAPP